MFGVEKSKKNSSGHSTEKEQIQQALFFWGYA
jgi:hypothetical protein